MVVSSTNCPRCGTPTDSRFCTACGFGVAAAMPPSRSAVRARTLGGRRLRTWLILGLAAVLVGAGVGGALAMKTAADREAMATGAESLPTSPPPIASDPVVGTADAAAPSGSAIPVQQQVSLNPTVIVLDASGSMKADDAPGTRIDAAKNAVRTLIAGLPNSSPVGLIVYGTSTDSSDAAQAAGCQDIKTLVPVGPVDKAAFTAAVDGVVASGYTPLGSALREAASALPRSGERTIVVVSDGDDTCQQEPPCDVAKDVSDNELRIHTVGFLVSGPAKETLTCVAQAGGGHYVDAVNSTQLQAFLRTTVDPNTALDTLTRDGYGDMRIGMSADQARAADPAVDAASTGTVVVVWRGCDLTFSDGILISIEPHDNAATQDGLAVGDDATKAVELYGSSTVQNDGGRTHAVFTADPARGIGYDVSFIPRSPGEMAGKISRIVLCRCSPPSATTQDSRIVTVTPFFPDGRIRLPLATDGDLGVGVDECSQSTFTQAMGVYRCGSVAASLPACWPSTDYLYCMHGPADDTVVRIWAGDSLPPSSKPDDATPWQIVLADGSRCMVRLGGAWGKAPDGYYYSYSCDGSVAALVQTESGPTLDSSGPDWTVTAQAEWDGPLSTVKVAQVIYAGVAPTAPTAMSGDQCPSAEDLQAALETNQSLSSFGDGTRCLGDWATAAYNQEGNAYPAVFQRSDGRWMSVNRSKVCPLPSPIPASLYRVCQVS